jgi:hypothetical protein
MPPVGFESTIAAGEWPQTYALDRAATGSVEDIKRLYYQSYWLWLIRSFFNILVFCNLNKITFSQVR